MIKITGVIEAGTETKMSSAASWAQTLLTHLANAGCGSSCTSGRTTCQMLQIIILQTNVIWVSSFFLLMLHIRYNF